MSNPYRRSPLGAMNELRAYVDYLENQKIVYQALTNEVFYGRYELYLLYMALNLRRLNLLMPYYLEYRARRGHDMSDLHAEWKRLRGRSLRLLRGVLIEED